MNVISKTLVIMLIFICCIGAASAADEITDDAISADSDIEIIQQTDDATLDSNSDETEVLSSSGTATVNTWTDLKTKSETAGIDYEITVENGTYNIGSSSINFKNNAKIIGSGNTVFTGGNSNVIPFTGTGKSITFSNLIFRNMNSNMVIQLIDSGSSKIENCVFENIKTSTFGQKSVVFNNGGYMQITNTNFTNCNTTYGVITNHKTPTTALMDVENCKFENNYASQEPGAINNCGILNVTDSTFISNHAGLWAGAIHTHTNAKTIIKRSIFRGNTAGWGGGALFTYSVLSVYDSCFEDNNCTGDYGGAIGAYNYGSQFDIIVDNCTFKKNNNLNSNGRGGAIGTLNGGYLNVYNSCFVANYAPIGQAIAAANEIVENGTMDKPHLSIEYCNFTNHTGGSDTVYINGRPTVFKNNIFTNSVQNTHWGSGNTYNTIIVSSILKDDVLGSFSEMLLSDSNVNEYYINSSSTNNPESVDGKNWDTAFGTDESFYYITYNPREEIGDAIYYLADGTYSSQDPTGYGITDDYDVTFIGVGNDVIFDFDGGFMADYAKPYSEEFGNYWSPWAKKTLTFKNIIFNSKVTVGSRNFNFINCTFNDDFEVTYDLENKSSGIINISLENCKFTKISKEDIKTADLVNLTFIEPEELTNDEGNVTSENATSTNSTGNTTSGNGTSTNSTGNTASGIGTSTNTGKATTNTNKQTTTAKVTKKATKITAKKATFKAKKKTKKYTITLKAGKAAVKKVKVTIKIGKKTYKATTNSKGKATFKITKLTKKGKYTAVIKFAGNKNYKATSKKVKITVKK